MIRPKYPTCKCCLWILFAGVIHSVSPHFYGLRLRRSTFFLVRSHHGRIYLAMTPLHRHSSCNLLSCNWRRGWSVRRREAGTDAVGERACSCSAAWNYREKHGKGNLCCRCLFSSRCGRASWAETDQIWSEPRSGWGQWCGADSLCERLWWGGDAHSQSHKVISSTVMVAAHLKIITPRVDLQTGSQRHPTFRLTV